jgi:hypothetical protein
LNFSNGGGLRDLVVVVEGKWFGVCVCSVELAAPECSLDTLMGMIASVVPVGTGPGYDLTAAP